MMHIYPTDYCESIKIENYGNINIFVIMPSENMNYEITGLLFYEMLKTIKIFTPTTNKLT